MDMKHLVAVLVIGLVAGWLAGLIMKGRGFGPFGDILVGIIGAGLGSWVFSAVGLSAYGTLGTLMMSLAGAVVLLGLIGLIKRT